MKFLLVYPRFKYPTGDPPLGPLLLMAYIRRELPELQLNFFDATFHASFKHVERMLRDFQPEITGIYCNTLMYDEVLPLSVPTALK